MGFTDIFIRRPVFASCVSLLILAVGLISFKQLTIRQFPKMTSNVVSISTKYIGANANLVESFITTPIENAISGVDGIDYITSSSSAGSSKITLNLKLNSDVNSALVDVNSNLSSILKSLPDGVDNPVVKKVDSSSAPLMVMTFSSDRQKPAEISDYLTRTIVPQFSNLPGVGAVNILGNRTFAMRIWLNPHLMAQYGVTATDIQSALQNNNVQSQSGEIDRKNQVININASTALETPTQFGNIVIKKNNGQMVRIHDVATVELGENSDNVSLFVNGKSAIGVSISAKSEANPLDVANIVKKTIESIKQTLPQGMEVSIPHDDSIYIQHSITEVQHATIEAAICVIIVIFLFIGSVRSILIPAVTIPLSLIGAMAFMLAMGYSINTLTLLAFVLAIGMVVDDAIVVLENIHRHIEKGLTPFEAALTGAKEIGFAVIAMTITLAAVYAPIGFVGGFTGSLFKEFAFTLAGTVIISGFVALTLSPMMCSKVMKSHMQAGVFAQFIDNTLNRLTQRYQTWLSAVLNHRLWIVMMTVTLLSCGALFFMTLSKTSELTPSEDQGSLMVMSSGPTGTNVHYTEKYTKGLEDIFHSVPEYSGDVIINGNGGENSAMSFLQLKPWEDRSRSANEIIQSITPQTDKIPGIKTLVFSPSSLPGSNSMYPVSFVIKTNGSYDELNRVVNQIMQAAQKNPGFLRVDSDLKLDQPEIDVSVDREKAQSLGVNMSDISTALNLAFGEPDVTTFTINGLTYNVIPQVKGDFRDNPEQINELNVKTGDGNSIPLSSLIAVKNIVTPYSLNHFQQQRSATISAVLSPKYSTQAALSFLQDTAKSVMTGDMSMDYSGDTRTFFESSNSMMIIFISALVFIYLVLSAQFESFRDPLIVLTSVPLSLVGALGTLLFAHCTLNIYTEIGLITLIGLIAKHGILIVEFANQCQRNEGKSILEAVIKATSVRLRPILMTTAAMVLGAIPLVFASGAGAESRHQMGLVIFGGMLVGTLFTLFVVPTMYTFFAKRHACAVNTISQEQETGAVPAIPTSVESV